MTLFKLLRSTSKSECSKLKEAAIHELTSIFPETEWGIDDEFSYYTPDNYKNIWNNELRASIRNKLIESNFRQDDYSRWLGEVHFINIGIYNKHIFEKYRSNAGWRIVVMSIPRAEVIALGIASHYQNAQNHNQLGKVSNLLFDIVKQATEETDVSAMMGRKISALDWDGTGLFPHAISSVDEVELVDSPIHGIALKDIRTTTLKKILASFVLIEVLPKSLTISDLQSHLHQLKNLGHFLAASVYPFESLEEFEAFRALALQDLAAANIRTQLRKKSSTRSKVRIYYGPPGTGKTLTAVREAVKIIDPSFNDQGDPKHSFNKFNEYREQCAFITFHPSLQYEDLVESVRPVVVNDTIEVDDGAGIVNDHTVMYGSLKYKIHEGLLLRMIRKASQNPSKEYVVVIDEINRGDVSRILGPLISALEPDKRVGAEFPIGVELQYPRAEELESRMFMPSNLHMIGSMNSSDRNIALVDHALRRRFEFLEIPPEPSLLKLTNDTSPIDCRHLLQTLNTRLEHLIDSDHLLGHGYLMGCDTNAKVIEALATKIIPLLREYFYGSEGMLLLLLGDHSTGLNNIFIVSEPETEFDRIFNLDSEIAINLGYRPHTVPRNLRMSPKFWNPTRLIPGPDDEDYAARAIIKIYQRNSISGSQSPSDDPA